MNIFLVCIDVTRCIQCTLCLYLQLSLDIIILIIYFVFKKSHNIYLSIVNILFGPLAIEKSKPADKKIGRSRPLYDIPYMLDAREFLRKKMIGKKVDVIVDYIQPKSDEFPEKICCTVTTGGMFVFNL